MLEALQYSRTFLPDQIDKNTLEIAQADDVTYTDMQQLADELPGHSPRYILLSYPLTLVRTFALVPSISPVAFGLWTLGLNDTH